MPDPEETEVAAEGFGERRRRGIVDRVARGVETPGDLKEYALRVLAEERPGITAEDVNPAEDTLRILERLQGELPPDARLNAEVLNRYARLISTHLNDTVRAAAGSATETPVRNKLLGADPVVLYSGEFVHEVMDLRVHGAGMDFAFHRTYRSQAVAAGPLGANWDHAYDLQLRESS